MFLPYSFNNKENLWKNEYIEKLFMKCSHLQCLILVTVNLTCSLTSVVVFCCVLALPSLCEAVSVSRPPFVFLVNPRTPSFTPVVMALYFICPLFHLGFNSTPPPPAITNAFKEHNLGLFHLKNCICGISIGVETGKVDRDQILNVVESRLHFVSLTFQIYLKWYVKK